MKKERNNLSETMEKGEKNRSAAVPTGTGAKRKVRDEKSADEVVHVKKRKSAAATKPRPRMSEVVDGAAGDGSAAVPTRTGEKRADKKTKSAAGRDESASKSKRAKKKNLTPRVREADNGGAAAGDGMVDAADTPARDIVVVHTVAEFLARTANFAPGSVLLSIGTDASLSDASLFWKFLSARQTSKRTGFKLNNMETLLHKATAMRFAHGHIDELAHWHNSLGVHVDSLTKKILKIDDNIAAAASSSSSSRMKSTRWPLDGVEFFLEANPEVNLASELKHGVHLEPEQVEYYRRKKYLPLLGHAASTSSSAFPMQAHLAKEPSPHPLAQKETRVLMRRWNQIQRDALDTLQQTLFDGVVELRQALEGARFLGCGATDYAEFSDSDEADH